MKKISANKIKSISIMLLFAMFIAIPFSCKKLDDFSNKDEKRLPYGSYVPAALIQNMEFNVQKINPEWQYQLQQNLNGDLFSQQSGTATPFAGNQNNGTYSFVEGWNDFIPIVFHGQIMDPWLSIRAATKDKSVDMDLYSVSLIIKVLAASRVTDVFGPIPYVNYGKAADVKPDSQEEIYNQFFTELKSAIDELTNVENATPNLDAKWAKFDRSNFAGDYKKWVQLANTLRLRLAMRISKSNNIKAKDEAQAAATHSFGLLEIPFSIQSSFSHPVGTISGSWGDILLGAPMGSFLNGYKDPRAEKYALPAKDPLVAGQIIGVRQGIDITLKSTYGSFSVLNISATSPVRLVSPAESFFLRAEGALKGWNMNGGTAQDFYEKGIAASFAEYGLSGASAYLSDLINNQAAAYVDPHNAANSVLLGNPILSTIPKQFGGTDDQKLEQIITQKWIALFPDGMEAWSEHRRTGYPKLWPVVVSYNTDIPKGEFVKRLPYSTTYKNSMHYPTEYVKLLGGSDNGNTKLWWNK